MKQGAVDNFELFGKFPEAERRLLETVMIESHHKKGHEFMREGDKSDFTRNALYLILDGTVGVTCQRPDGDGFAVNATMGPGEIFGIVGLVSDWPRSATCTALDEVTVGYLDRAAFQHMQRQRSPLAARFQLMLARQLVANLRRLTSNLAHALETGESSGLEGMFKS